MPLQGSRFLSNLRLRRIVETLASKIETQRPLRFLGRTQVRPAYDDEIIGRFTGNVFAADVIALDQAATVYTAGKMELVTNTIPKLKIGKGIPESQMIRLLEMEERNPSDREMNAWLDYELREAASALLGVRQRMNALICAMRLDLVNYDRYGIKLTNATFGCPADLKSTTVVTWDTPATATPITDIQNMRQYAQDTYGKVYDRITMSNKAFDYMINTDQFKARVTVLLGFAAAAGAINVGDRPQMLTYARQILDMVIELEDTRITEQALDGTVSRTRVMPANKVELSSTADDGNADVTDFANGLVVESGMARIVGDPEAEPGGLVYGPYGYWTVKDDLNPPEAVLWNVARGWPRRHEPEVTAILTVGAFS